MIPPWGVNLLPGKPISAGKQKQIMAVALICMLLVQNWWQREQLAAAFPKGAASGPERAASGPHGGGSTAQGSNLSTWSQCGPGGLQPGGHSQRVTAAARKMSEIQRTACCSNFLCVEPREELFHESQARILDKHTALVDFTSCLVTNCSAIP